MIQPYLPPVEDPGEVSLIFIDDEFSHAVGKGAVLGLGDGVQERPWENMVFLGLTTPSARQSDDAAATVRALQKRFAQTLAYARVDLVQGTTGDPLVLEVELIDPNLSLHLNPAATSNWQPPSRAGSAHSQRLEASAFLAEGGRRRTKDFAGSRRSEVRPRVPRLPPGGR